MNHKKKSTHMHLNNETTLHMNLKSEFIKSARVSKCRDASAAFEVLGNS
ncbi:MAG: hypothetical protein ACRBBZ_01160 [Nitrosopumilus sp.]